MRQLAFLTYLSRSGSTLLASMLDEHQDIAVSLEATFFRTLLGRPALRIGGLRELDEVLTTLFSCARFQGWRLDRGAVRSRLLQHGFPIGPRALVEGLLAEAFGHLPAIIHVVKHGPFIFQLDELKRTFPEAKVIFVQRDPRSVFCSQKNTRDSDTRQLMNTNPLVTAMAFNRAMRVLEERHNDSWVMVVKYEDLISRPESERDRVCRFLNAGPVRDMNGPDYYSRMVESQKGLHVNVRGPMKKGRARAWQAELQSWEIDLIERVARRRMLTSGYQLVQPKINCFFRSLRRCWCLLRMCGNRLRRAALGLPERRTPSRDQEHQSRARTSAGEQRR